MDQVSKIWGVWHSCVFEKGTPCGFWPLLDSLSFYCQLQHSHGRTFVLKANRKSKRKGAFLFYEVLCVSTCSKLFITPRRDTRSLICSPLKMEEEQEVLNLLSS